MTMPAGKYFVGDLCYVMHDVWDEVCSLIMDNHEIRDGEFTLKDGHRFAMYSTLCGDGEYRSNRGTSHCVDSGSIGAILVSDIHDDSYSADNIKRLGAIIDFDTPFETSSSNDGTICIGHVNIYTGFDEDEEWDEDEDEEWDEEYDYQRGC